VRVRDHRVSTLCFPSLPPPPPGLPSALPPLLTRRRFVNVFVCACVCACVCVYVYTYIYTYIYVCRFVISQSISKRGYETVNSAGQKSASLGHVKLAQRMEMREPGTGPVSGDRVQVAMCVLLV